MPRFRKTCRGFLGGPDSEFLRAVFSGECKFTRRAAASRVFPERRLGQYGGGAVRPTI
jgi:hypothetical protein